MVRRVVVEVVEWRTDLLFEHGRASSDQLFLVDHVVRLLLVADRCGALHTVRRAVLLAATVETVLHTVCAAPDARSKTLADRRFTCCSRRKTGGGRCSCSKESELGR